MGHNGDMYSTANVTLMVKDLDRSVHFYGDTLGLTLQSRHGDHWAEMVAPGMTIGLHPTDGTVVPDTSGSVSIGLLVDDFATTIDALKERGVAFDRITETDRANSAYFTDPDGHPIYVMWRAPRPVTSPSSGGIAQR